MLAADHPLVTPIRQLSAEDQVRLIDPMMNDPEPPAGCEQAWIDEANWAGRSCLDFAAPHSASFPIISSIVSLTKP